jgi:hypothetical protein
MKLLGDAPTNPFEEMLVRLLSAHDRSTDKPETKAIRASALAAVITKQAARQNFLVINHSDIVGMQFDYDCIPSQLRAAETEKSEFLQECMTHFCERVQKRMAAGVGVVMARPEPATFESGEAGEVIQMRVNFFVPGYGAAQEVHNLNQFADAAREKATHPGGSA